MQHIHIGIHICLKWYSDRARQIRSNYLLYLTIIIFQCLQFLHIVYICAYYRKIKTRSIDEKYDEDEKWRKWQISISRIARFGRTEKKKERQRTWKKRGPGNASIVNKSRCSVEGTDENAIRLRVTHGWCETARVLRDRLRAYEWNWKCKRRRRRVYSGIYLKIDAAPAGGRRPSKSF